MDTSIFEKLNEIFLAMNNPSCSDEDRKNFETFLNEFIQHPESIFVFIQFLSNEAYSEQACYYAFSALEKMIKHYWKGFSIDEKNQIIEKLLPLIFIQKKVSTLIRTLFYEKIKDNSYIQLWNEIFLNCKNELQQENVSIEKVDNILQNISYLSELLKNIYRGRPVDSEYLVQFNEITAPFFNIELINSENGLSILKNSIKSIVNLFGRSISTSSDEYADTRICELCQFFLKLYEAFNSISDLNDQQLNYLQSFSSEIYSLIYILFCRYDIKSINEQGEAVSSQLIHSILSEWKPQIISLIFNLCLSIFNKDPSKHFIVSKIIRPLTIDDDLTSFIEPFFVPALRFISIPNDEMSDFFYYPEIFYQSQYCTVRDEYGSLRNNTILIYQNMFSRMNASQIAFLFQNVIQNSEAEIFLVAKNAKCIIEKGATEVLMNYIYSILKSCHETKTDLYLIPSILYLFSKSIVGMKFNFIPQLIAFNLFFVERFESYQKVYVPVMVSVHFLYRLKKLINKKISEAGDDENGEVEWASELIPIVNFKSIFPDEKVMNLLFQIINSHTSSDIFKLIEMIAQDHNELYSQLPCIYGHILKGIMDEVENYQSMDTRLQEKSQIDLKQMFSLLISIIEHNSDSGIEEELFNVLSSCLKLSRFFDITEEITNVIAVLIQMKSVASMHYLRRILSFISMNGEENGEIVDNSIFRKSVLDYSIPFIVFMSNFPSEFIESGILNDTCKILIDLMREEVIDDAYDDFGLFLLLTWIFQLQPQIVSKNQTGQNEDGLLTLNPSFFFEYVETRKNRDEVIMESALMNLALTFVLLEKIDLTVDFAARWMNYIKNKVFIRSVDIQFHKLALQFFINQTVFSGFGDENNMMKLAMELVELMESNPNDFLQDDKSTVSNIIGISNINYPIFSLFTQQ